MFYLGWLFDILLKIFTPIMFAVMIDEIVYYKNIDVFLKISIAFMIMVLFSCVVHFFTQQQYAYLQSMYSFEVKKDIFDALLTADSQYMSDMKTGENVTAIQNYAGECMVFVIRNIIHLVNNTISLILYLAYVFILGWQLGLIMFITVPLSVYVSAKFGKKIKGIANNKRDSYGNYYGWIFEMLSGMRDIRMLGAQKIVDKKFVKYQKKLFKLNNDSGVTSLNSQNIITSINLIIQLMIFGLCAYLSHKNSMTIGLLTIIITYFAAITERVSFLSNIYIEAQNRIASIQWVYDILNAPTEKNWSGEKELIVTQGNIKFNDISFSYNNGNKVLDGLCLNIHSGDRHAIVGKSGSGKTTVAYMLVGFYKPSAGYIEIDGQRLSDCSLKSIRKNIGIIQQNVLLFDGTIKENIMLGNNKASYEELISACERAGAMEFIEGLPNGIDTVIGKKGIGLSGGQKQRLAIARIYLKDPKIIIFDEATSSLDNETEEYIHEAWRNVLAGRTSIVIAHREKSVMLCDNIAILDSGKISEKGTPMDLVNNSSNFQKLFAISGNKEAVADA
jgi:ABC-type bacteriocin/lantibiotic exporter with double-glycine peptidase domain